MSRTREARDAEAGFTLLEVLIAMVIMVIAFLALLAMLLTSVRANASAIEGTNATGIARGWIEEFKLAQEPWHGVAALTVEAPDLAVAQNIWQLPAIGAYADGLPHDTEGRMQGDLNAKKAIYCVHYRTSWQPAPATAVGLSDEVLVTVRVAWSENLTDCANATVENELLPAGTARAIMLPTIIRRTPP